MRSLLQRLLTQAGKKRLPVKDLLAGLAAKAQKNDISDFELQAWLRQELIVLAEAGVVTLPAFNKRSWDTVSQLPYNIQLVNSVKHEQAKIQAQKLQQLREQTAWEPNLMVAFAHELRTQAELSRAVIVNDYLKKRQATVTCLPHRERALQLFHDEKALDPYVHKGLFAGRVQLADLDCFYCPPPLPYESCDKPANKPLLVIENSNTYWSACQFNQQTQQFAAVIYGQGFTVSLNTQHASGLSLIEKKLQAKDIFYFGDLDPTGLAIAKVISDARVAQQQSVLQPMLTWYQALLKLDLTTPYARSQIKDHDPAWCKQWLGDDLAELYLARVTSVRWPQEALTLAGMLNILNLG